MIVYSAIIVVPPASTIVAHPYRLVRRLVNTTLIRSRIFGVKMREWSLDHHICHQARLTAYCFQVAHTASKLFPLGVRQY